MKNIQEYFLSHSISLPSALYLSPLGKFSLASFRDNACLLSPNKDETGRRLSWMLLLLIVWWSSIFAISSRKNGIKTDLQYLESVKTDSFLIVKQNKHQKNQKALEKDMQENLSTVLLISDGKSRNFWIAIQTRMCHR